MEGAKTFINNTGCSLSVLLTVRKGDIPGNEEDQNSFSLEPGEHTYVQYGGSDNPYLDGIAVNAVTDGAVIASQEFVITRSSDVDNALNVNDTVSFVMQGESIALAFSNTAQ